MINSDPSRIRLRDQLIRSAKGSVILRIASLGATFATSVVLARALGPEQFGTYSYVFAIITLLALPSQIGIPTLLVRETAKAQANEHWSILRGLWHWATRIILLTSIAVSAAALIFLMLRWNATPDDLRRTLLVGLLLIPLVALGNARGAALRGLRHVVAGQLPESVIRPLLLVALVASAWYFHGRVSAAAAMSWHVLSAAVAFAVGAAILHRVIPAPARHAGKDLSHVTAWKSAIGPLALITGLQVAGNQTGIVLLGLFRPETEVGLYKVASSGATLTLFGLQTANLIFAPHIARLNAMGDQTRLQRLVSLSSLVGAGMTVPMFLGFLFGGTWLLALMYGHEYVNAYSSLIILCGGQVFISIFGSAGLLLSMTGHERDAARWLTVSVGCNIGTGLILIPAYGMVGAAVSALISIIIWNIAFWRLAQRRTGVDGSLMAILRGRLRS